MKNGGYINIIDENFRHLRTKPEINNISFIRPNLKKLYEENKSIEMFAYVTAHRTKDNRYVLYNLCSESLYLSDHVIVDNDPNDLLFMKIGQCIRFDGQVYKYDDKYSVYVSNIKDLNRPTISILNYNEYKLGINEINSVFESLSEISLYERLDLMKYLITKM